MTMFPGTRDREDKVQADLRVYNKRHRAASLHCVLHPSTFSTNIQHNTTLLYIHTTWFLIHPAKPFNFLKFFNMKLILTAISAVIPLALCAATPVADFYPAPCGRSVPPGVCMTSSRCERAEGFWVERDCTAYGPVTGIGCCYDIPGDDDKWAAACVWMGVEREVSLIHDGKGEEDADVAVD
jgi:hypothetical protein